MKRYLATVKQVEYVGSDVIVIYFAVPQKDDFHYEAGQYITIYFKGSSTPQGKASSLSSSPHEELCSITVKNVGEFSGKLYKMKQGDHFEMSDAYGHFNPHTSTPLVGLSAGVGIAPVWSIIKHTLATDASRTIHLFYSNTSPQAIAHKDGIDTHTVQHGGFKTAHHITRSSHIPHNMHAGRVNLDTCVNAIEGEATYLICGSVEFVNDMWRRLIEKGVPQEMINTEIFFE